MDAIAALLADTSDPVTSVDIAFVAQQEERRKVFKTELKNAPPHPIPNDEEWATYKAFLMDRMGDADWIGAYRVALNAIQDDRKGDFQLALDLLFKRARNALFAQFEV